MIVHYVIVRRDLPLGVMAAMVTHAAGESAVLMDGFTGSTAVVLAVDNELQLLRCYAKLEAARISLKLIQESDGEFAGQCMAIGVRPQERDYVFPILKNYKLLTNLLDKAEGQA